MQTCMHSRTNVDCLDQIMFDILIDVELLQTNSIMLRIVQLAILVMSHPRPFVPLQLIRKIS